MTDSLVDGFSRSMRQDLLTCHLLCFPHLPRFYRNPTVIRTNCTEPLSLMRSLVCLRSFIHRLYPSVKVAQQGLAMPSITKVQFARCHRAEDVSCNKVRVALQQVSSDKHWANLICLDTPRSFSIRMQDERATGSRFEAVVETRVRTRHGICRGCCCRCL